MVTASNTAGSGGQMVEALRASGALDELFAKIDSGEVELTGSDGLLPALLKESLERGLAAELTDHLGYEKGEPTQVARGNARNGTTTKTTCLGGRLVRDLWSPGTGQARSLPV